MIINTSHTPFGDFQYFENDYFIAGEMINNKLWDQDIIINYLADHIKRSNIILDIGSHIGTHSIAYAWFNSSAAIHSFEMQSHMYDLFNKNIAINYIKNIHPYHCAVGEWVRMVGISSRVEDGPHEGEKYSYYNGKQYNLGGVSIGDGPEEIMMITIDSLKLKGCDFMKIDVEGFEFFVIKGAKETIQKFKPVIYYEKNHKKLTPYMKEITGSTELKDPDSSVETLLKSYGYNRFQIIEDYCMLATCEG